MVVCLANAWDCRSNPLSQTLPLCRPFRTAMEQRLLRAFAGLINRLRQEDLGIERYIWRSQDDAKVRDSHAEHDDQVFRWDDPPAGGHPGEAHNCRCYAEPIAPAPQSNVLLVGSDGSVPLQDLLEHELRGGHTIAQHLGKSDDFLLRSVTTPRARSPFLSLYRYRHGSFPSLEAARKLTNSNLANNAALVEDVVSGRRNRAFLTSEFSSPTGTEAFRMTLRNASPIILRQTFGVGTVIEHAPDMPDGFIIITSYPRRD